MPHATAWFDSQSFNGGTRTTPHPHAPECFDCFGDQCETLYEQTSGNPDRIFCCLCQERAVGVIPIAELCDTCRERRSKL